MISRWLFLFFTVVLSGCATISVGGNVSEAGLAQPVGADEAEGLGFPGVADQAVIDRVTGLEAIDDLTVSSQSVPEGLVFGRTDFRGVLKAPYVRMTIVSLDDPSRKEFFYIGSRQNQSVVPWSEGKLIEPGYFYLSLPKGSYEVTAFAIPVGSTQAEEGVALLFDVVADAVLYLGTLEVNGTKERIRFGGIPFIRPGFEYILSVHDEFDQALADLQVNFPDRAGEVRKGLFVPVEVLTPKHTR